jgi:hypothetical protein
VWNVNHVPPLVGRCDPYFTEESKEDLDFDNLEDDEAQVRLGVVNV